MSAKASGINSEYQFFDQIVPAGKNYYRLKMTNADGMVKYSATRLIILDKTIEDTLHRNPVKGL